MTIGKAARLLAAVGILGLILCGNCEHAIAFSLFWIMMAQWEEQEHDGR